MTMKYVRKLMLVPVEEWEKIRKQQPKITQVASVKVEQSPQMKKYESDELWQKCYNKKEYETDNETEIETENEEETEGESEGEGEY